MITDSIAANGTPSTAERQTAPPPSEIPNAPTLRVDVVRPRRQPGEQFRTSWSSRGPSIETRPPDCPWPRASKVSTT